MSEWRPISEYEDGNRVDIWYQDEHLGIRIIDCTRHNKKLWRDCGGNLYPAEHVHLFIPTPPAPDIPFPDPPETEDE